MMRRMLACLWCLCVAASLTAATATAQGAGYLAEYEDLPLAPGLEQSSGGLVFETAAGRIVEGYAEGRTSREAVVAFYAETLPQLGWQRQGEATFRREGEELRLEFSAAEAVLVVRFVITPAS